MEAGGLPALVWECREQPEPGEAERGEEESNREGWEAAEHSHPQTKEDRDDSERVPTTPFQCQFSQNFLPGWDILMFSYFIKLTSLHQADDTSNTDDDAKSTISAGNQSSWCELNRKYLAVAHYVAAWQRDQHRAVLHILIIFWASVSVSSQSHSSLNAVMLSVRVCLYQTAFCQDFSKIRTL